MVQRDNLKELVDFEYTMITGIGDMGQKVTKEQKIEMIKKNWDKFGKGTGNLSNNLRMALICKGSVPIDSGVKNSLKTQELIIYDKYERLIQQNGLFWIEENKNKLRKLVQEQYEKKPTSLHRFFSKTIYFLEQYYSQENLDTF